MVFFLFSPRTLQIDYRSFLNKLWEAMPADDFIAMISDPNVLGNPLLRTQHFFGASRWERISDTEVVGYHQLRVPHQVYTDATLSTVAVKGHAHSANTHWYRKVDGVWKFAGLDPHIRWFEYDFDKVFATGREQFGTDEETSSDQADGKADSPVDENEKTASAPAKKMANKPAKRPPQHVPSPWENR